jgi:hypothetical protein
VQEQRDGTAAAIEIADLALGRAKLTAFAMKPRQIEGGRA